MSVCAAPPFSRGGCTSARVSSPVDRRRLIALLAGASAILTSARAVSAASESHEEPTDWPAAIAELTQAVGEHPGHAAARQQLAVAYNNYGVSLGDRGQWALAIQQLQQAMALDSANQQFRENLTKVFFNQAQDAYQRHQVLEAVSALDQAITLTPNFPQGYALRGEIEYNRQKLKEAKAAWQRALALDPTQTALAERLRQVTQELPVESKFERLSQASFDLRYEEVIEHPVGFDVQETLLEARRLVGTDFACWPRHKLVVLIYSAESFHALRQETPDWVGGQFDGKIRVPMPSSQLNQATVKQILFHEYTHALVYDLTKGQCPTWMNEGLAEYEGRTQQAGSVARLARAYDTQRWIPWTELSAHISTSLPAEEVALAYEESYSIVAYLVKRYGFWRIRRILKAIAEGRSWDAALGEETRLTLDRLEANWRDWLPEWFAGG